MRVEKTRKVIPKFKDEEDERRFWAKTDSTEYLDWPSGKLKKFVGLKTPLKRILPRS
jgi:hypothetical protein